MYKFKANLHCHSVYSALDGMQPLKQIADKAEKLGLKSCALTEHGNLYSAYKWHKECKDRKLKAIIGYEAYMVNHDISIKERGEQRFHLTLLANGRDGLLDLGRIASAASSDGFFYKPRVNWKILEKWNKSKKIICLSGCLAGLIPQMILAEKNDDEILKVIERFQKIFNKDNFFLELMPEQYEIPEIKKVCLRLTSISRKYEIPIVATNDSHYINKDDAEAHDLLLAINTRRKLDDPDRFRIKGTYDFKSPEEMDKLISYCPEALETTGKIADMIDDNYYPKTAPYMPTIKSKVESSVRIENFCKNRLKKYFKEINAYDEAIESYKDRFKLEYNVLKKYNLFDYFAVLKVIIDYAQKNNIYVGPGRGSAAGSLISFLLGITGADPLKYGLLFGRFLNEGRLKTGGLPDIDIDIESYRRQEIYEFIRNYFGVTRTCNIITFSYLKPKSAIKDTGRALGIDYEVMNELTKNLPDEFTFEDINKFPDVKKVLSSYPKLLELSKKVSGSIRQVGQHAAGLIISPLTLTDVIPVTTILNKTINERVVTSQYDMKDIDSLGLIKIDVLGSSTQTQIHKTIDMIKENHNIDIDISKINVNEPEIYKEIFCKMNTASVFQVSSDIVKSALSQIQPKNIQDLTVLNAIVRPGSKEFIPLYVANKNNPSKIKYPSRAVKHILDETYGILIYQEQVMEICKSYAGFTEAQSDDIRKAVGKKIPELIDSYREKFTQGAILNGHNEEEVSNLYSLFVAFGEYGFNKSHALCYSLVSYHTAWLKYHYPKEFYAATLSLELIDESKIEEDAYKYIRQIKNEMLNLNIELLSPDINKSYTNFSTENKDVRFGLAALKGISKTSSDKICQNRDSKLYKNVIDFFIKNNEDIPPKNVLVSLIMSGAFNSLNKNKFVLMQSFENISKATTKDKNSFENTNEHIKKLSFINDPTYDKGYGLTGEIKNFNKADILRKQKEISGTYFDGHPMDAYSTYFKKMRFNSSKILLAKEKESVHLLCNVIKVIRINTKKGDPMCFLETEDFFGDLSITVFPKQFIEHHKICIEGAILSIRGTINIYGEKKSIIANEIVKLM